LQQAGVIRFRIAALGDAAAIAAFVNATYHGPEAGRGWTPETHLHKGPRTSVDEIAAVIADPAKRIVVCEDQAGLLGCAQIERHDDTAFFGLFAVRTTSQNTGTGKAVMAEAEREAVTAWRCRAMKLTVMSPQDKLLAFYERRGYRQTGERDRLPEEAQAGAIGDYDLIVMRKELS
jgi:ribosomal protein S18 acetylase RimI-like enzyme